jgi:integrase
MPKQPRFKTKYPGVYFIEGIGVDGKPERVFYIQYRKNGKLIEEKAGRQFQDDMTAARAAGMRTLKSRGDQPTNEERREARNKVEERWTIGKLWEEYKACNPTVKAISKDDDRYKAYLKTPFDDKEPKDLVPLDVDRMRIRLQKKLRPATVKNALELLRRIANFGVKKHLCEGLSFTIQMPDVYNEKTEDLSPEQLSRLLQAIESDANFQVANLMKLALFTGMRKGELFKLKWQDVDFERGFISIKDPKGGPDQKIPMNDAAREILLNHPRTTDSEYVFPGADKGQRRNAHRVVNRIKKSAGLPKDFRPLHGLRHVYASMLASSGQVDMYTLQKLLTHKSPTMTQRYAHLRDETLRKASDLAGTIIEQAANGNKSEKVVKLAE